MFSHSFVNALYFGSIELRQRHQIFMRDFIDAGQYFRYTDRDLYRRYPTVHHLITELMQSDEPHDVRLVYQACAWLVAHRGHFLSEVDRGNIENVRDFDLVYDSFISYFQDNETAAPWNCCTADFAAVMQRKKGITAKERDFFALLFDGKKPKGDGESYPYDRASLIKLLCGGKVAPNTLFGGDLYNDVGSVALGMKDEDLAAILAELGDDAELIIRLKAVYDWAVLVDVMAGKASVSEAKVAIYEQHKKDLRALKAFIRKYCPKKYGEIFRYPLKENYVAYSQNLKSVSPGAMPDKLPCASKEAFSKYLLSVVKSIECDETDKPFYDDMLERLGTNSFLPKQVDSDNRVIPYQLYWDELTKILKRAEGYLPFLTKRDADGLSVSDKILSIFTFRVPYYLGPLNLGSEHAWFVRKASGKIYPWNFDSIVDHDRSEQAFIDRMTNTCTYLPGEPVLPRFSLCYCRYAVLNEINKLCVNGTPVSVECKQAVYERLFMRHSRVSVKQIENFMISNGYMQSGDTLSGIDITVKASLKPQLDFARMPADGALTEDDAERIIERKTYTENKARFTGWLKKAYPALSHDNVRYICGLKYSDFGRLSRELLMGIEGMDKTTGECGTMLHFLWETNCNLMQLLSDRFTFTQVIDERRREYYSEHPAGLSERLSEMYVSNAVKRPIFRTLDIVKELVKAAGAPPKKIFVEMARGASPEQRGKRTKTRMEQLRELYSHIDTDEVRLLSKQLDDMGSTADNRLQSESLFLYYLQLGKCIYSGEAVDIEKLKDGTYNIDHVYPQSYVKDDSITANKVLVQSAINGEKGDIYPIPADIRRKMYGFWRQLLALGLMSEEKYKRLVRDTPFTADEKLGFINRQLVETRQSSKAVTMLLKERYPDAEIVYVKAGLVSDFRKEFNLVKSRSMNDLHHAKDAYLNIAVGNVYHERFSKRRFDPNSGYTLNTRPLFTRPVKISGKVIWDGAASLAVVRDAMRRNSVHLTRFAFCRHGGLFDQMPLSAKEGLVPRKAGLDPAKYGGYNKTAATFFIMARYVIGKKADVAILPVELMVSERFLSDAAFAEQYTAKAILEIVGKPAKDI